MSSRTLHLDARRLSWQWAAAGALALMLCASPLRAQPHESGPITIGGSAQVQGPVTVHGTLTVAGRVFASGPLTAAYFTGPVSARGLPYRGGYLKVFKGPLTVHGDMVVNGDLTVAGPLTVDGPIAASGGIDADGPMRERDY
ncbi:hypothetical protein [Cupriavidus necator]